MKTNSSKPASSCPISRFALVVELVRGSDPSLAQWLDDALVDHVEKGQSMDFGLGLSGHLGRSPRFHYLSRRRATNLSAALDHLGGDLKRLAREVTVFERLPAFERENPTPPGHWPPWRKAIHSAARLGLPLPKTPDGLAKALAACADGTLPVPSERVGQ